MEKVLAPWGKKQEGEEEEEREHIVSNYFD